MYNTKNNGKYFYLCWSCFVARDLTHGNIKTIHENEVKAYKNLETL